jgi:pimeloyl-ACP methyl ester carboxylesterase
MSNAHFRTSDFVTSDGTRLTLFSGGTGRHGLDRSRPTIVLCNGLGGNATCWQPFAEDMSGDFNLLCWDYRGLFRSDPSANGRYDIAQHASDLLELLDAHHIDQPILVGWSMGVQVILEHLRHAPHRASAFVALNGTPGTPFRTVFDADNHDRMQAVFSGIARHWTKARWMRPFARLGPLVNLFIDVAQRLGLASRALDRKLFRELGEAWVELDLGVYSQIFTHLSEHDATAVLRRVTVPSLLVGGDADTMTPLHRTTMMASEIPGSELLVIRGGTHFSPVEYPHVILPRVRRFLTERLSEFGSALPLAA